MEGTHGITGGGGNTRQGCTDRHKHIMESLELLGANTSLARVAT